ncbi:hypothetical protein GQ53DRAFT_742200 [Thozetella sp. PMI_491]|nr:hypothetical protein GQ53DRAFT_742200 [Thozetella sp. PMI_491]
MRRYLNSLLLRTGGARSHVAGTVAKVPTERALRGANGNLALLLPRKRRKYAATNHFGPSRRKGASIPHRLQQKGQASHRHTNKVTVGHSVVALFGAGVILDNHGMDSQ